MQQLLPSGQPGFNRYFRYVTFQSHLKLIQITLIMCHRWYGYCSFGTPPLSDCVSQLEELCLLYSGSRHLQLQLNQSLLSNQSRTFPGPSLLPPPLQKMQLRLHPKWRSLPLQRHPARQQVHHFRLRTLRNRALPFPLHSQSKLLHPSSSPKCRVQSTWSPP